MKSSLCCILKGKYYKVQAFPSPSLHLASISKALELLRKFVITYQEKYRIVQIQDFQQPFLKRNLPFSFTDYV